MIRRFAAATAVASGLALSLTGCLGDAGDKAGEAGKNIKLTAAAVLGKTAENTSRTDTFKADMSMRMTEAGQGDVSMKGTMQYRTKPDLAYSMNFSELKAAGQDTGGMEQILVGRTMYMKMPMLAKLGGGAGRKPWMKVSLDELGQKSGMNMDQLLEQSRQMDPVQNTKLLTASKDARKVGEETVGGIKTTHYTGTYRMADGIAKLPAEQQERARKTLSKAGMDSMAFDVWVDRQNLPRKMEMKSRSAQTPMTVTMTYREFGKPVQIAAPPADQVTDFSAMLKGLGNLGGSGGAGSGAPSIPRS
ncbi:MULTISPECIES: LppX_LprAFG lipoprotein [Actinomadura]|uniref:LppX_LprAFG lipoprotein n=1 Tax=Actinomadura yumaensis TaxID=111807 RepID=A0ABW2CGZ3_9ACTN|nr:LppX_LprAFG lipoprotein [Actinomadura sp. J1-007]MWK35889.1 LppX_LprAFG lipoprotein [Actinomadura sp. J1-007]